MFTTICRVIAFWFLIAIGAVATLIFLNPPTSLIVYAAVVSCGALGVKIIMDEAPRNPKKQRHRPNRDPVTRYFQRRAELLVGIQRNQALLSAAPPAEAATVQQQIDALQHDLSDLELEHQKFLGNCT